MSDDHISDEVSSLFGGAARKPGASPSKPSPKADTLGLTGEAFERGKQTLTADRRTLLEAQFESKTPPVGWRRHGQYMQRMIRLTRAQAVELVLLSERSGVSLSKLERYIVDRGLRAVLDDDDGEIRTSRTVSIEPEIRYE